MNNVIHLDDFRTARERHLCKACSKRFKEANSFHCAQCNLDAQRADPTRFSRERGDTVYFAPGDALAAAMRGDCAACACTLSECECGEWVDTSDMETRT